MLCLIHQEDSIVAAVRHNLNSLEQSIVYAAKNKARIVITPELYLIGYPPKDLLAYPNLYKQEQQALNEITELSKQHNLAVLVGHLERVPCIESNYFYNCVTLFDKGKRVGTIRKQRLPNYDIFEENRFFQAWPTEQQNLTLDGISLGIFICEDAWDSSPAFGISDIKFHSQASSPWPRLENSDLLINVSASPYTTKKRLRREELFAQKARELNKPLIYSNCVGAQDDLLFDGGSFACNSDGDIIAQAKLFEKDQLLVNPFNKALKKNPTSYCHWKELNSALVMGIKAYSNKNHFKKALVGLSGGIDSALTACLAAKAMGKENIIGVSLPSKITSEESKNLARLLAESIGIEFREVSIENALNQLSSDFNVPQGHVSYENLQARIRGTYLMSHANIENALLLATCNKSEASMGYTTLYGDMCGTLSPLGDLYKTEVFAISHFLKNLENFNIPTELLLRKPTAELSQGQLDSDSLPPYELLDLVLKDIIENQAKTYLKKSFQPFVEKFKLKGIMDKVFNFEFKRKQAAPILRVHHRAFGSGWRFPLSKDISSMTSVEGNL